MDDSLHKLLLPDNNSIAYHKHEGKKNHTGVIFLGGFMSDMTGTKATSLEKFCKEKDYPFVRFDYFGHGKSSKQFTECTIGMWKQNVLDVIDNLTTGRQILIGSSMGGWLMMLVARERPERIAGLIGIASAPDFTEDLIWDQMNESQKSELLENGVFNLESEYGEAPYPITRELIEEGRKHLVLQQPNDLKLKIENCKFNEILQSSIFNLQSSIPIRLIHGLKDRDVPASCSIRLAEMLKKAGCDVEVKLVENGDHRMATKENIALLCETLEKMVVSII